NTFDCTGNSNPSALYNKYIYEGTEPSRFNSELETSVFHSSGIYSIDDTDSFVQPASIFPDKNKILHGIESYNKCSTSGNKENEIFAGSEAYTESDIDMSDYSSHLDSSSSSTPLCIVDPYDPYSVQEPLEQTGYSNKTTLNLPSNKQRKTALDYLFEIVQTELFIIEKGAVNKTRHSDFGTRRYNVVSKSRQFKNDINGGMRRNSDFKVEDDNGVKKKRGRKRKIYTQDKLEPGDFLTYKDENNEEKRFPLEIVNGRKIYFCPFERCNRNFPSKSRIKRHFVVHTDDKPYKCLNPYCQKAFSRKDNMIQHYKSHCIGRKKGPSLIN
ncbi:Zinc finger C2H2 protein, partial [Dictyocoela roeselum]